LWGLGRTVPLEHPELACVRVDLEPGSEDAEALGAELGAGDGEDQVAYRGGKRYVARLVRAKGRGAATPSPEDGQALQLQIATRGVLDNLKLVAVNRRGPGKGEVEIQVEAAGLNFRDVLNALGMYPGDPGLLGGECAGRIVAVGKGVEGLQVGDLVVGLASGALSSYVTTEARLVTRVPRGMSVEEGATIPMVFLTAHYALNHLAQVKRGERVLIHAAAGGVGMAAVQLAQRAGAEIFATAGSPKKRAVLQSMGVPHVMDSRSLTFAEEVMARTQGEGIDIVLNSLTDDFIPKSLALLRRGGRFLEIGKRGIWDHAQVRRMKPEIAYHVIYLGEVVEQQPALVQEMLRELIEAFEAGHLAPLPRTAFSLRDAASAFRYMAQAKHVGKVVLRQDMGRGRIVPDATYLVTGGLGSLGLAVAQWLVAEGAQHLVLVGRHGPHAAAQTVLAELAQRGAQVVVRQADVAHAEEVQALLDSLGAQPPLRGIIHAAGVLDDGVLLQQTWERFAKVLASKALGAWHLHQATEGLALDFFVLFSSVASVLGSAGQGNYAAANAYLDGLAWYRRGRGLPALSINWGPWGEVGMAARLEQRDQNRQAAAGIRPIPPALGVQALEHALASDATQWTVLPVDWAGLLGRFPAGGEPPLFRRMASEATRVPAPPARDAAGSVRRQLEAAAPDARPALLLEYVRGQVAQILGLDRARPPADTAGLTELGMDSLMAVEFRNRLQAALGVTLPSNLALEYPTIEGLSARVFEMLDLLDEADGAALTSKVIEGTEGRPIDPDVAKTLLGSMGELTDEQVDQLLSQMTRKQTTPE
jgi:myxalamid-type polyketide synthase MxaB